MGDPESTEEEASATPSLTGEEQHDYEKDMDSLHILPLSIIPFELKSLKRAKLIKNVHLETVIEMFKDERAGSGQVRIEEAAKLFGIPTKEIHPDIVKLKRLATLNSFDVYSLRVELRNAGVPVNDHAQLRLSESKTDELSDYMRDFTRPLISQVYADSDTGINDVNQIIDLFKNPNRGQAMENLKKLATTLDVSLPEIPRFLEDYGDVFLSLAYFKDCLNNIVPSISDFIGAMAELRENFQLKHDRNLMDTTLFIENTLNTVTVSITEKFDSFERHSNEMWSDINAQSFSQVKHLISNHHSTIGGLLCGLAVKMSIWDEKGRRGGPQARGDFIMSEMRHGIEKIAAVEAAAPKISHC
jgi:hypothetical protein